MRDLETMATAVTAAETGHLVFSTLHTTGAANTIERIIGAFPPHQQVQQRMQLAAVLEAVVSQILIPRADGFGNVMAPEILMVNSAVRNLIREGKTHQIQTFIQTGKNVGMTTLDDSLLALYKKKQITLETLYRYAVDDKAISRELKRVRQ